MGARPGHQHQPQPEPRDQPGREACRQAADHHGRGQHADAGFGRTVAQHPLHVLRDQHLEAERGSHRERLHDVRPGDITRPEYPQRKERGAGQVLPGEERGQQHHRDGAGAQRARRPPAVRGRLDDRVDGGHQAGRHQQGAGGVRALLQRPQPGPLLAGQQAARPAVRSRRTARVRVTKSSCQLSAWLTPPPQASAATCPAARIVRAGSRHGRQRAAGQRRIPGERTPSGCVASVHAARRAAPVDPARRRAQAAGGPAECDRARYRLPAPRLAARGASSRRRLPGPAPDRRPGARTTARSSA